MQSLIRFTTTSKYPGFGNIQTSDTLSSSTCITPDATYYPSVQAALEDGYKFLCPPKIREAKSDSCSVDFVDWFLVKDI